MSESEREDLSPSTPTSGPRPRRRWRRSRAPQPPQPDLEPKHDQPWIPRSALTDRLRRSPRQ